MRHLTRLEQIKIHLEILYEYKRQIEFLIFIRENEKKELEKDESIKTKI